MIIYLIGLPGVGKTTIGKQLAQKLQFHFQDLDNNIELSNGISISKIFQKYGENLFRELEKKELINSFKLNDCVISTGGGTPCFFDNMDLMNKNGVTVYLSSTPQYIYDRLTADEINKRPLLSDGVNKLDELYSKRKKYYEKSQFKINIEDSNHLDTIVEIIQSLT